LGGAAYNIDRVDVKCGFPMITDCTVYNEEAALIEFAISVKRGNAKRISFNHNVT
jgi:hypothetical protein